MKRTTACLVTIAALLAAAVPAVAQKVGTTSMQFLKVMPSARGTAMGDAYTVFAEGADAVFWNPGGVALVNGNDITTTYIDWIFDTYQGAVSYATSLSDLGAFGIQAQYVDYGTFDETVADNAFLTQVPYPGMTGRQFHPMSYLVGVSYASSLTDRFSTGITAKFAHESLFDKSTVTAVTAQGTTQEVNTYANALLFDFGLVYQTGYKTVRIGAAIQNFGASIRYANESSPAPLLFRLGIGADLIGENALMMPDADNRLSGSFDLFQPNDYTQQMHAGVEYEYHKTFAVRAGYKFNYDEEGLTLGAGIRQTVDGYRLSVDYSYVSIGEFLGKVHRISLGATL